MSKRNVRADGDGCNDWFCSTCRHRYSHTAPAWVVVIEGVRVRICGLCHRHREAGKLQLAMI